MSDEDLSEYFPLPKVLDGIFNLCSQLFDVEFSEVDCEGGWNPDVKLFAIRDLKSDQILGHFYLDAYLREEKGYAGGLKKRSLCTTISYSGFFLLLKKATAKYCRT